MGQIFKERANAIARLVIFGGPVLIFLTGAVFYALGQSDYLTGVHSPLDQPIPFSHQHHVGGLGIDCRYCHTSVTQSSFAGLPPTETCMTCHSQVWKDAPVLKPVRDSFQTGIPIKWTRVYDLPDYVYFNHGIHVNKGVACVTCHGRVDEMPITWKTQPLYMRWCLDCHRQPEKYLRQPSEVFDLQFKPFPNRSASERELVVENHVHPQGLTDCYTCHR
jgi:Cytochrome c7 and related cytochrome c